MALRDLRLRPYVWSMRQAMGWGALVGAPFGGLAWILGCAPAPEMAGSLAALGLALAVAAILSALSVAGTALIRNAITRWFYRRQKLETLRRAAWAPGELAAAGSICFAVFVPPALAWASRLAGWPVPVPRPLVAVPLLAIVGGLYLLLVGVVRRALMVRMQG